MIVIVSWYSDGSGQPEVSFHKLTVQRDGVYGVSKLIETVRDTRHKECRAWDIDAQERVSPLYESVPTKTREEQ